MKRDCFAFVSKYNCSALISIDCKNCRFYKTKEQLKKEKENAKIRNNQKGNR